MNILIFICLSLGYLFIKIRKNVHILQQNFYNENCRYLKWGIKNIYKIFNIFDIVICLVNLYNLKYRNGYLEFVNILYFILFIDSYLKERKRKVKIPLKYTYRIKRLFITLGIVYILTLVIFFSNRYLVYFVYSIYICFNFILIFIINIINVPIEKGIFYYYKKKATKKLRLCNNMVVIGITGSYGKTSSKNILYEVLNVKYRVLMTPKNYNTLYGIMITINNYLDKFCDVFIVEMGAFKLGSINKLCKLVHPEYGIITNIGLSHLETFHTKENIQKGKFELVEALPKNSIAILNMDDEYQVSYHIKNEVKIIWIGINNHLADIFAKDIMVSDKGSMFKVCFKDDSNEYLFETNLLGNHNIYNILNAIAIGKYMGLNIKELQLGVKKVMAIPHRLEIKRINDLVIIDDSYNSNPVGANMALDILKLMDGIKIIVTPGMIELGMKEDEYNKNLGKYMSKVVDYVILIGKKKTKAIYEGLIQENYEEEKIFILNDIQEAFKIINGIKGKKYVLLENDLPDIFKEN